MSDNLESGEIMQLNKKDWNSKEAKDIAAVVAVVIFVVAAAFSVFAVAFAIGIVAVTAGVALALDAIAAAIAAASALVLLFGVWMLGGGKR